MWLTLRIATANPLGAGQTALQVCNALPQPVQLSRPVGAVHLDCTIHALGSIRARSSFYQEYFMNVSLERAYA